ncbi:MAG: GDSL family lipase [Desulfobulbaceae bacterium]|nr:GDSL family lipase [Desulfobulbaceae bacterium]
MSRTRKISRLLLIGDSLIEYGDWQYFLPGREVVNLGRSGESVEELRERAVNIVRRQATPDLVLVMIGTNNVAMGRVEFIAAYADILAIFQETWPAAVMVINSLLPMDLYHLAPGAVPRVNDRLRALAEQKQALYLDAWSALADQNNLAMPGVLEDEVHLTARGYRLWAACLEEFLISREQFGLCELSPQK